MIRRAVTAGAVLALGLVPSLAEAAASQGYRIRVTPALWYPSMDGEFSYVADGFGSDLRTLDELNLADGQAVFQIDASLRLPILLSVHAGYFNFETSGSARLDQDWTFGDFTFSSAADVDVELTVEDIYAEVDLKLPHTPWIGADVGLAVHLLNVSGSVRGQEVLTSLIVEDDFEETIPVPALAGRVYVSPPGLRALSAEARIHWIGAEYGDYDVNYLDFQIQASYQLIRFVGVTAGYRHQMYDMSYLPDDGDYQGAVDVTLSGFFLGVHGQF